MSLKTSILLQKLLTPAFIALVKLCPNWIYPVLQRSPPDGDYAVGMRDIQFAHETVDELPSSGRGMARIWYPAAETEGLTRRSLYSQRERVSARVAIAQVQKLPEVVAEQMGRSLTWSHEGAKIIEAKRHSLPVVVFSHGFGLTIDANTQLCEHLASHGYIVIAVAHPSASLFVSYPDGSASYLDLSVVAKIQTPTMLETVNAIINAPTPEQRRAATVRWCRSTAQNELQEIWISDIVTCLDSLINNRCDADLSDIIAAGNFTKIGAAGMSFGGSVSVSLAEREPRFVAAINLDGGQVGDALLGKIPRVPLLMLHSSKVQLASGGSFNDFHYAEKPGSSVRGYLQRAFIKGADHNDFTDLTLHKGQLLRRVLMLGDVDGERMIGVTNALCLEFFNKHVRAGRSSTANQELTQLIEQWPELQLYCTQENVDRDSRNDLQPVHKQKSKGQVSTSQYSGANDE